MLPHRHHLPVRMLMIILLSAVIIVVALLLIASSGGSPGVHAQPGTALTANLTGTPIVPPASATPSPTMTIMPMPSTGSSTQWLPSPSPSAIITPASPTPTAPPSSSPCPPNGTPERPMYRLEDSVRQTLWEHGLIPTHVFVMGYQNCVTTMAPDALGFVSLEFATASADERTYPAQVGRLLQSVIPALIAWPETVPFGETARADWQQMYVYLYLREPAGSPSRRVGVRFILTEALPLVEAGLTGTDLYNAIADIQPNFGPYEYYLDRYYYTDS